MSVNLNKDSSPGAAASSNPSEQPERALMEESSPLSSVARQAMSSNGSRPLESPPFATFRRLGVLSPATTANTTPSPYGSTPKARPSSSSSTDSESIADPSGSPKRQRDSEDQDLSLSLLRPVGQRAPLSLAERDTSPSGSKRDRKDSPVGLHIAVPEEDENEMDHFAIQTVELDLPKPSARNPLGLSLSLEDESPEPAFGGLSIEADEDFSSIIVTEPVPDLEVNQQVQEKSTVPAQILEFFDDKGHGPVLMEAIQASGMELGEFIGKGVSAAVFSANGGKNVIKFFNWDLYHRQSFLGASSRASTLSTGDKGRSTMLAMLRIRPHPRLALPVGVFVLNTRTNQVQYIPRERALVEIKDHHEILAEVSPKIPGSSLLDIAKVRRFKNHEIYEYAKQVCDILELIHEQGVLHRDLNPGNFIVARDGLVVIDWGTAISFKDHRPQSPVGSILYRAPETHKSMQDKVPYGVEAEVFSLGCIVYRMIFNRPPPLGDTFSALEYNPEEDPSIQKLPKDSKERYVLSLLMAHQPAKRPNLKEARALIELLKPSKKA